VAENVLQQGISSEGVRHEGKLANYFGSNLIRIWGICGWHERVGSDFGSWLCVQNCCILLQVYRQRHFI
jgi:hypothetical protein